MNHVERRQVTVGALAPETSDRAADDPRVHLRQRRVIGSHPLQNARSEVVDYDVGAAHQVVEDFKPALVLEIDHNALGRAIPAPARR